MVERLLGVTLLTWVAACDGGSPSAQTDGTEGGTAQGSTTGSSADGTAEGTAASSGQGSTSSGADETGGADEGELPPGEGCCEAHEGPGCNEQAVAVCVCDESPECCVFDWYETCAERAQGACAAACESDDSGGTDSGQGGVACRETMLLQLGAAEAMLSGDWALSTSQAGEGQIVVIDPNVGTAGEVLWNIDVPCEDTWTIWVRLFDQGEADSFLATLDGEPSPPAIFEGGIQGLGQGWNWRALNWRDPDDLATFIEDPWAPQWGEGTHALALRYRESIAVARIEVTNDPAYAP